jgi:hypothetical protein
VKVRSDIGAQTAASDTPGSKSNNSLLKEQLR